MLDHSPSENYNDEIDNTSLNEIRLQLSEQQIDFEQTAKTEEMYSYLEYLYKFDVVFLEIFKNFDTKEILKNSDIVNKLFLRYLKALPIKTFKFENIFITFCDFFNFGYDIIYKQLHIKIQKMLESRLLAINGKKQYKRNQQKYLLGDDIVITSIFDL